MKIFTWLLGIVVALLVVVYIAAFTTLGNNTIKPLIETEIQKQTHLPSRLSTFYLRMSEFRIVLELNKNNTIALNGTYSLFGQSFDVTYNVKLKELKTLKPLTQTQLESSFYTDGYVKGNMQKISVKGSSDVAKSNTTYNVELEDFNPTSIIAKVDSLDLSSLLYMLNQKQYAKAKVNLDVNFKNITPHKLDGNIVLLTKDGALNRKILRKDFNLTIPATAFAMKLNAQLKGDTIDYNYVLHSNLARLHSLGKVIPQPLKLGVTYTVNVKELALLQPITGAALRGPLRLEGKVEGTKAKMRVSGTSDIAASKTDFSAVLHDFAPETLQANIRGLKIQKLLYMLRQPHYADALFDMNVNITNASMQNLQGSVTTKITKGLVDSRYMTKAYEFNSTMPRTTFSATTQTQLHKTLVNTKVDFLSNLADIHVKNAQFNLKDNAIKSDYVVKIDDLNQLYFVTNRHLKGSIQAYGDFSKAKDLDFTAHSKIAGGELDAKLHNDDFHADLNALRTLDILDMLLYPKIFKANIDADVDYNLAEAKGTFKGFLSHGTFTKNKLLDAVKKYAHTDMYVQKFQGDVNANIKKENIAAAFDLRSNSSSLKSKNTRINTLTKRIYSKVEILANKNPLTVTLQGDIDAPKVTVDATKLIQKEATKALQKEAKKYLKGKDAQQLQKEATKLLKGLF